MVHACICFCVCCACVPAVCVCGCVKQATHSSICSLCESHRTPWQKARREWDATSCLVVCTDPDVAEHDGQVTRPAVEHATHKAPRSGEDQNDTFRDPTSPWFGLRHTIGEAFALMGASSDDCDSSSKRMLRVAVSDPRHAAHKFAHTLTQAAFGAGIRARETVKRNKGTLPCVLTPRGVVNKQSFRAACPDTCNDAARSSFNKFRPTFHARLSCVLLKGTRLFHARLAHNLRARAPEHPM